ncbi:phage minor head protein [Maritalea mediterranea]|uniref:Minor capsid protein n=1 Tax=Maritalea mediterranea TaxID=2909667 RepID=A0ABS9E6A2_9HYPH|nr:phage minor head protein [Maritalea mediterranea]MCF4097305.1 minor capsid protein [Maritalea mediterranea]
MPSPFLDRHTPGYKNAFNDYLRYGTPIERSLKPKAQRQTGFYIWTTRQDQKVRASHAANHGKIFAWDNPPPTGHPGEDFGCRCRAVPYVPSSAEQFEIKLHDVSDNGRAWSDIDYLLHYFYGKGRAIRLRNTGNLVKVVREYRREAIDDPARLPCQIAKKAREVMMSEPNGGVFTEEFSASYDMTDVVFSLGWTTIKGMFRGNFKKFGSQLYIGGTIDFELWDEFRDPLNIGAYLRDNNIDPHSDEIIMHDALEKLRHRLRLHLPKIDGDVLWHRLRRKDLREIPHSKYYTIADSWGATVKATVYADKGISGYDSNA